MEANTIKCPKCSSTQLFFDKKGFSGKKAVVGAVLTGGIGLLAGTLGSNKVVANCLACGTKFSPSTQKYVAAVPQKPLTRFQQKVNTFSFGLITFVLLILFLTTLADTGFSFLMFLLLFPIAYFGYVAYCSYWISKKPVHPNQTLPD